MRKVLRWAMIGFGGLIALLLLAALTVFVMSEMVLRKEHSAAAEALRAPSPQLLADAPRQAKILGCISCHGEGLKGKVMFDVPGVARVFAPNVTLVAARASDQQLAAAIRQGVGVDKRALVVMPSPMYSHLSDEEVAALIAWIRKLPRAAGGDERSSFGPLGRLGLATGRFETAPAGVAKYRSEVPIDLGAAHSAGRNLAAKACSECHGPALFGKKVGDGSEAPDLSVAGGYDLEQFKTLLRRGVAPSGKPLGLMKAVAVNDFVNFTDAEIEALYRYLEARAKRLGS
jgi:cytochrome c553